MILLFQTAPKHSTEVPSSVPEHKKAAMCLLEKICVLEKPHAGISYGTGHESNVNAAAVCIKQGVFKQRHK